MSYEVQVCGANFKACLVSIARGDTRLDEVAFLHTDQFFSSIEIMLDWIRRNMAGPDLKLHLNNATILWMTGRVFQPSVIPEGRHLTNLLWCQAPTFYRDENVDKPDLMPISSMIASHERAIACIKIDEFCRPHGRVLFRKIIAKAEKEGGEYLAEFITWLEQGSTIRLRDTLCDPFGKFADLDHYNAFANIDSAHLNAEQKADLLKRQAEQPVD